MEQDTTSHRHTLTNTLHTSYLPVKSRKSFNDKADLAVFCPWIFWWVSGWVEMMVAGRICGM
jgi:hypothetical protein